jgi:hypothetical protein
VIGSIGRPKMNITFKKVDKENWEECADLSVEAVGME